MSQESITICKERGYHTRAWWALAFDGTSWCDDCGQSLEPVSGDQRRDAHAIAIRVDEEKRRLGGNRPRRR